MNLHLPNTWEAVIELKYIASVPLQIVSPQASSPVIGLVQDSLLGSYLFSKGTELNLQEIMSLTSWINSYSGKIPWPKTNGANPKWTSQQMISMFLPQISYMKKDSNKPEQSIKIVGGNMTSGLLDKSTLGAKNNSLFHITWNDYGPLATRDFFNNMSHVANAWLQMVGFSTGLIDCVTTDEVLDKVKNYIAEYKERAVKQIEAVHLGNTEKGSDPQTIKTEFPGKMVELLNSCRGKAEEETRKALDPNNSINAMVTSGSKGNPNNIVQIISLLGQQEVDASWITEQYYRRTLPHFHKDDLKPEAHGFIENSYMSGLGPAEYWFHAQAGRVGIISRAIKTAETGYIQRKLIKALEDLRICYDGTVRNANNIIIQTVYGNDGFDATYHEKQKLPFINYNMARTQKEFKHLPSEDLSSVLTPEAFENYKKQSNRQQLLDEEFAKIVEYQTYLKTHVFEGSIPETIYSPIHCARLLLNVVSKFNLGQEVVADIDPTYIIQQVKALRQKIAIDPNPELNYVSTVILNSLIATNLSSKNLIYKYKFNKTAVDHLIETIYITFLRVIINPGENVGVVAAQSLGEPTTQLTLDTFHHTGLGSKANVARGVPRIRELLSLTRNPKTPSLTIQVLDDYFQNNNKETKITENYQRAEKLAAEMEFTVLEDLLNKTEIIYDEDDHKTCITEDQEFIDSYYDLLPSIDKSTDLSQTPWLVRMEFNREMIMNKHLPLSLIEYRLRKFLEDNQLKHSVILSDENSQRLICRIKIEKIMGYSDPISYLKALEKNLLGLSIRGIIGIDKGHIRTVKKDITLEDGTIVSPFDSEFATISKDHNHLRYLIDTDGSNLVDVLNLPNIDMYNTLSNDVWEIYSVYGIEAARSSLIHEINEVLYFSGTTISQRHIDLLVDVMTNQGTLVSVDRHGVNKTDSGPLHRASFEETTTQITNASIFNEVDQMTGVSGNIMFGQFIPTGTNAFKIVLDLEQIETLKHPKQPVLKTKPDIAVAKVGSEKDQCGIEDFEFTFKFNTKLT